MSPRMRSGPGCGRAQDAGLKDAVGTPDAQGTQDFGAAQNGVRAQDSVGRGSRRAVGVANFLV